ncbi:MAG: hypothetical protein A2527_14750 [Candidatus Lambdaproteobacteria bacterium RIFOXYD2_FULL_50_16]|uniref:Uncharacterized protein n=1 Tax=Candidatus Lambdaproteobacteria bacterium RIFOXYD2_FULL_50_16 TaxID=1817772 RepID=A0A1F6G5Q8_9PROT|nr:MAG: hypothetical protein A2527_14750 [Candidatus Lambdaproteobacteria bacterium RIFOXYD2_FULL_50_16]
MSAAGWLCQPPRRKGFGGMAKPTPKYKMERETRLELAALSLEGRIIVFAPKHTKYYLAYF